MTNGEKNIMKLPVGADSLVTVAQALGKAEQSDGMTLFDTQPVLLGQLEHSSSHSFCLHFGKGLLLTVMVMATQGDIVTGLIQLLDGYDADIIYEFPNATKARW